MVSKFKEVVLSIVLIGLYILSAPGCANQLPPGGGPQDTTPPEIVEYYPLDGTVNFTGEYFELTFSEYVDKRSLKDAIFISPALKGIPEIDWSGKSVRVYFPEKLLDSITYTISIGTDVIDYNNRNRMAESFVFAFSTGDKIDNFTISGKVFEDQPSGTLIFAYRNASDTLNPADTRPDYISQAGQTGEFKFTGLAAGTYRLFGIKEEIKDQVYDPEKDKIGIPPVEPVLSVKDTGYSALNMILITEDYTTPRLLSANMLDRYHIHVTFSEELDQAKLSAGNFKIVDSTSGSKYNPVYFFKGRGKQGEYFLSVKDSLNPEGNYVLQVSSFADVQGNARASDAVLLTVSGKPDTVAPILLRTEPSYNAKNVDHLNALFTFIFDDGFDTERIKNRIAFKDSSDRSVTFDFIKNSDASISLKPVSGMRPGTDYFIAFNFINVVDAAGNAVDSNYIYKFKTLSELDYTGLSGIVQNIDMRKKPLLILESEERGGLSFRTVPSAKETFEFNRVLPGKYKLYVLYDTDGDGKITPGQVRTFKPSEEFYYHPETVSLLPRWMVTDFIFNVETP